MMIGKWWLHLHSQSKWTCRKVNSNKYTYCLGLWFFEKPKWNNAVKSFHHLHNFNFSLTFSTHQDLTFNECREIFQRKFEEMAITYSQCERIEQMTRGQAKNLMWYEAQKTQNYIIIWLTICLTSNWTTSDRVIILKLKYRKFLSFILLNIIS